MPDITDPSVIQFYTESIQREKKLRIKWFNKNIERIRESAAAKTDYVSTETVAMLDKFKNEMSDLEGYKKQQFYHLPMYELAKFEAYVPMKPVPEQQSILLTTNESGKGRLEYLKQRFKMNPEDKYYFPECSSYVYGWELKKSIPLPLKRYPRMEIVKKSFYRKSGVSRDPDHYREPAVIKPNICSS